LLSGHPAKASEGEASDYSGSTAWRGSVRTLLTLKTPAAAAADRESEAWRALEGDPERPERIAILRTDKANYAAGGAELTLATAGGFAGWRLADPVPAPAKGNKGKSKQNGVEAVADTGGRDTSADHLV